MQTLLLSDLRLALPVLLDDKADVLAGFHAGRLYAPRLAAQREAIEALPEPSSDVRPLSDELAEADVEHDGFAAAIWHYTEAVRVCPGLSPEVRSAAALVRETYVPSLSIANRSYATEAAHALGKRARLGEHEAAFARLPVPDDATLGAWVERFVTHGETIESLLRARAEQVAAATGASRSAAARLRAETIALLGRLRTALADELAATPDALARADAELFTHLDQLAAARKQSTSGGGASGAGEPTSGP